MLLNGTDRGLDVIYRDIPKVIVKMNESPFQFHLTGSRGWPCPLVAGVTYLTDWDFFVKSSEEVYDFLYDNLFVEEFENPYADSPNSASVWKHAPKHGPSVHVQVVRDVDLKLAMEQVIRDYLPATFYKLNKDQRKSVWSLAYAAYNLNR